MNLSRLSLRVSTSMSLYHQYHSSFFHSTSVHCIDQPLNYFMNWLKSVHINVDWTSVHLSDECHGCGIGAIARIPLAKHHIIAAIPPHAQLTTSTTTSKTCTSTVTTAASIIAHDVFTDDVVVRHDLRHHLMLALPLLAERRAGHRSVFNAYIDVIPQSFITCPMFFTHSELLECDYPPIQAEISLRGKLLQSVISDIIKHPLCKDALGENTSTSASIKQQQLMNELGWALVAVTSRDFNINGRRAMVPFADSFNHGFGDNSNTIVVPTPTGDGGVVVATTRDVNAGEELLLNYGAHTNETFLIDYAFMPTERNCDDSVTVPFSLRLIDTLCQSSMSLLECEWKLHSFHEVGISSATTFNVYPDHIDTQLLFALHVGFSNQPEELSIINRNYQSKLLSLNTISDVRVLKAYQTLCYLLLARFRCTERDDDIILANTKGLSQSTCAAVSFRRAKKQLLKEMFQDIARRLASIKREAGDSHANWQNETSVAKQLLHNPIDPLRFL